MLWAVQGVIATPAAEAALPETSSLVGNPGFETSTDGWDTGGHAAVTLERVPGGHTGSWSAKVTNTGSTSVTNTLNDNPNWVQTSQAGTYTGSLWVRSDSGGKLYLRLREYQGNTKVSEQLVGVTLTTAWQQVTATLVPVAPGASTIDLSAAVYSAPAGSSFYADDAALALATSADSPPSVPRGVTAAAVSSAEVDVSWTASTDTDATGVAGYLVTRNGTTLATVGPTTTGYADTTVSASTTYSYTVTAFDTAQNYSAPSGPATVTTPPAATTGVIDDLWHMDESSGTTMVDSGSTPHPGVLHNIALGRPGDPAFASTSYGFNGTSSYVDVGNSNDLNAGDRDVHIALSLNTTTVPPVPDYDLFRKGQAPGTEYKLELQPNGQFSCQFNTLQADGSTIKQYVIQPAIDLHDGKWHRLTCSKVGGTMTVTVDGVAFTRSIAGSISNSYHMIIGAYSAKGGGDYYQGLLDEVSFRIG